MCLKVKYSIYNPNEQTFSSAVTCWAKPNTACFYSGDLTVFCPMDVAHGPDCTFSIHPATTDRTILLFCFENGQKARLDKTKSAITVQRLGALGSETEYRRKADRRQQDFVCQSYYVVSRLLNVHVKTYSQNTSKGKLQASCSNSIKTW